MKDSVLKITLLSILSFFVSAVAAQTKPDLIFVEGGNYMMGRDYEVKAQSGADIGFDDEVPLHRVTVSSFHLGKTEVTVAQYKEFVNSNTYGITMPLSPEDIDLEMEIIDPKTKQLRKKTWYDEYPEVAKWVWKDENPMTNITWRDAVLYCNWLSEKNNLPVAYLLKKVEVGERIFEEVAVILDENGKETSDITKVKGYRLPTEAEWEFAARGGNKSQNFTFSGSNNPVEVAWTDESTLGKRPMPVAIRNANELGFHDMSGNAWEWCWDFYDKNYYKNSKNAVNPLGPERTLFKSIRGGSWYFMENVARSVVRDGPRITYTDYNYGFRVAKSQ